MEKVVAPTAIRFVGSSPGDRLDMPLQVRQSLAACLVTAIAARMNLPPRSNMHPETFLEEVAYGMRSQGRLR